MHALLERTLLRVDVLTLDLCFDDATAQALREASEGTALDPDVLRSRVVTIAMGAPEAIGVIEFKRGVSLRQFLDGVAEDHDRAVKAGLLSDSTRVALRASLPEWYEFLEDRRIQKGDRIYYRFRPGQVRTTFLGVDGRVYLDRVSVGAERRNSVLGAYLAPDSSLGDRLVESLFDPGPEVAGTEARCRTAADLPPT